MKETNDLYLFWRHQFGQWTKRDMVDIDGAVYNCCEQFMMAKKALLFNDQVTLAKIMATDSAKEQQAFGREVENFNAERWDEKNTVLYGLLTT